MTVTQDGTVVRVYFNDSSFKTFKITDATTALDLCKHFGKKLSLPPNTIKHFCLNVVHDGVSIHSLGNQSNPMKLHKEYSRDINGWGTTNNNCFLFSLKAETAKRMTMVINRPVNTNERLPAKGSAYRKPRMFTLRGKEDLPSFPTSTPTTGSNLNISSSLSSSLSPSVDSSQSDSDRRTREFATTKLQSILDSASSNETQKQETQNTEDTEDVGEEVVSKFMDEMDELVAVIMQLSTPVPA